jgi:polysaccharide pyruvyl transferase WcaK-like protein
MDLQQRSRLSFADLRDPTRFPKSDYIELLYEVMLRRKPDPNGLRGYSHREDPQNFFREILCSHEFKEISRNTAFFNGNPNPRKRILLFGAYGNGNLGDAIQAISLLRAIKRTKKNVEVWACSQLPCQFPFPFEYVLSSQQISQTSLLNQFDLMIIGGGGLLSHAHDPLTSEDWQKGLEVPVVLFGVGAAGEVAQKCSTLIKKAVYVSGRDEPSLTALRRYRADVRFVPDPVLADRRYYLDDRQERGDRPRISGRLWILKNTREVITSKILQGINVSDDKICFVEPFLDFPLLNLYPSAVPIYFLNELISLIDRSTMVISTRYHGCILAMLRNKPVAGLFEQKSLDLLKRYDLHQFFVSDGLTIPDASEFKRPQERILKDQEIFRTELNNVLSLLPVRAKAR